MNIDYFITENNGIENHAGSKARNDIDEILISKKIKPIRLKRFDKVDKISEKINILFLMFLDWMKVLFAVKRKSVVLIQYPLQSPKKIVNKYIQLLKKAKKIEFIALIHDLESLRFDLKTKNSEIEHLNQYSKIICHNSKMNSYLVERGVSNDKLINLEIFDYLTNETVVQEKKFTLNVNIAGNLSVEKSKYVYDLDQLSNKISYKLFGPNFTGKESSNISYLGQFPAEQLPSIFNEGFGLIWDGSSLETCEGITGKYLMYNNPHKISLYIVSELPLIIWKEAALASFVIDNEIGIAIDSLHDLDSALDSITEKDYLKMVKNLKNLSQKLKSGYYTNEMLNKI